MHELEKLLRAQGIDVTIKRLGLDFDTLFPGLENLVGNPYRHHTWLVKENHGFLVVNAIPDEKDQDHLFWEEWYSYNGEVHHHQLTLYKPFQHHEVFNAPASDDIHPPQCFGKAWYVVEDPDMRSLLLRR